MTLKSPWSTNWSSGVCFDQEREKAFEVRRFDDELLNPPSYSGTRNRLFIMWTFRNAKQREGSQNSSQTWQAGIHCGHFPNHCWPGMWNNPERLLSHAARMLSFNGLEWNWTHGNTSKETTIKPRTLVQKQRVGCFLNYKVWMWERKDWSLSTRWIT